ncbi:uncharacterized protein LOC118598376 [Oryzias melastigma]|uniref:uncharacterized protein LOC118598376 n=1 Tax=Oryzias melastigma TaxID=30732 RepID=UPI00168D395B|nr:uncharacterized protein LOC118598376 [Oryzias melastigma]
MEPLENGLLSFNRLTEMILSIDADIVTPGCQTFDDFRQEVHKMKIYFNESEQIAGKELKQLDEKTVALTADQGILRQKKEKQKERLQNLKTLLTSHESSLKRYTQDRDAAQRNLVSAKQDLKEMEGRRDNAQTVRDVGIGLFAIPIFGWIAGATMVGVGQTDLNSACDLVEKCRKEVCECDSQVKTYTQKVSDYEGLISKAKKETEDINSRICKIEAELKDLSVKRETVANLQSQTGGVVHHLGLLSGEGNAAELQTRKQILVEAVMRVMNELTPALTQIIEDGLLPTQGLKRIMEQTKTNNRKLEEDLSEEDVDCSSCSCLHFFRVSSHKKN